MNPPAYPEAVHNADKIPTITRIPAVPLLFVRPWIGPLNVSAADAGPIDFTNVVSSLVIVCGSPTRPTTATIANSAGKIDNTVVGQRGRPSRSNCPLETRSPSASACAAAIPDGRAQAPRAVDPSASARRPLGSRRRAVTAWLGCTGDWLLPAHGCLGQYACDADACRGGRARVQDRHRRPHHRAPLA